MARRQASPGAETPDYAAPDELSDLPPSSSVAFLVLDAADAPLSTAELAECSRVCPRTLRDAVNRLQDAGLAAEVVDPRLNLTSRYALPEDDESGRDDGLRRR